MSNKFTIEFKYPKECVTDEQKEEFVTNLFLAMKSTTTPVKYRGVGEKQYVALVKPYIVTFKLGEK